MTPIETMLDTVDFKPVEAPTVIDPNIPYVTHAGVLRIGEIEIEAFVLSNGQRIITEEGIKKVFGEDIFKTLGL